MAGVGCSAGEQVPVGDVCVFTKHGFDCENGECVNGVWSNDMPTCQPSKCRYSDLSTPVGVSSTCADGVGLAPSGTECAFSKPDHSCEMSVCHNGEWSSSTPVCTGNSCEFNVVSSFLPSEVVVQGQGCFLGGTVNSGAACGLTKELYDCQGVRCSAGQWSTPVCTPKGAPVAEVVCSHINYSHPYLLL